MNVPKPLMAIYALLLCGLLVLCLSMMSDIVELEDEIDALNASGGDLDIMECEPYDLYLPYIEFLRRR